MLRKMLPQMANQFAFTLSIQILINNFSTLLQHQDFITEQDYAQKEILNSTLVKYKLFLKKFYSF